MARTMRYSRHDPSAFLDFASRSIGRNDQRFHDFTAVGELAILHYSITCRDAGENYRLTTQLLHY